MQKKIKTKARAIKKNKMTEKCDWHTLVAGNLIKVSGGPYWLTEQKEKIGMGYAGIFKVIRLGIDYIVAYPINAHESGMCIIYMGEKKTMLSGIIRKTHNIRKVILREKSNVG